MNTFPRDNILLYDEHSQKDIYKLLLDVQSEVRDLKATVFLLRTEILTLKSPEPPKTTSFAFGLSPSQVNTSNESSGRRNTSYTFDEPISFVPLSPPPRRKPIARATSMATLSVLNVEPQDSEERQ